MWCNYNAHTIGAVPSSGVIGAAHMSMLYHVNFARSGQIMNYIGGVSPVAASPSSDNYFYVAFPQTAHPNSTSKKRYFVIHFTAYDDAASTSCTVQINDSGGTPVATIPVSTSKTNDMAEGPNGASLFYMWSQDYDATHGDCAGEGSLAYNVFVVHITNVFIGTFSAFEVQPNASVMNTLTGRDFKIHPTALMGGMPVRGYTDPTNGPFNVGSLFQNQHSRDAGYDSLVASSRRCLFAWCHPQGRYIIGAGAAGYDDVFEDEIGNAITFKVFPRELRDSKACKFDLALVARSDTGTKIKVTAVASSTSVEINLDASSDPKLYVSTNWAATTGLAFETIRIEAYVSSSAAVELKSLQLFESETLTP
jgi:hypothetical protein